MNNAGENFLTESGVYKLIFKSRKKEAELFQDWVTDEVLPTIRKTGGYGIVQTEEDMLTKLFPESNPQLIVLTAENIRLVKLKTLMWQQ